MKTPALPFPPSASAVQAAGSRLLGLLREGLAEAGIRTGPRRYSTLYIDLDRPIGLWLTTYADDLRWWRITFGIRYPGPYPPLANTCELTLHHDEFDRQIGRDLARLLHDPALWVRGEVWRWPLFAHDRSYPTYAWSELAARTYEADRLLREEISRRSAERRAAR